MLNPYPAKHDNPDWLRLTELTVISRRLFAHYDAELYYSHAPFFDFCKTYDHCSGAGVFPLLLRDPTAKELVPQLAMASQHVPNTHLCT